MSRTISVGDLSLGAPVYGSQGKQIGEVNQVVENPSAQPGSAGSFYFEVDQGGFMGIGASHLYIPIDVVKSVDPKGGVVLTCTADEAGEKYARRPEDG